MARQITPQSFEQQAAGGRLEPVYVLTGPDGARKAELAARLVETIEEDFRPFNVDKLFPPDNREEARKQFWGILQLARTLPMMAPHRVIIAAQAEKLMPIFKAGDDETPPAGVEGPAGKRGRRSAPKAAGEAELEALEAYLKDPSRESVLVFVPTDDLNRNLKPVKLLQEFATMVECDPLAGARGAIEWVLAEAAGEGVRIERAAARLLAELAGGDITRLRAEFERAVLFASGEGIVTEAAVREVASAPTTQNPWAMTNAIEQSDAGKALYELDLKLEAGEFPPMILGQIRYSVSTRFAPRRVPAAVEGLLRTDLALKSSGDARLLLERLVVELCGR